MINNNLNLYLLLKQLINYYLYLENKRKNLFYENKCISDETTDAIN